MPAVKKKVRTISNQQAFKKAIRAHKEGRFETLYVVKKDSAAAKDGSSSRARR